MDYRQVARGLIITQIVAALNQDLPNSSFCSHSPLSGHIPLHATLEEALQIHSRRPDRCRACMTGLSGECGRDVRVPICFGMWPY